MTTDTSVLFLLFKTTLFVAVASVATSHGAPVQNDMQAMMYLSQFGYFNSQVKSLNSGSIISADSMSKAISEFQAFAGLNITGILDVQTAETMSLPRCGVKDKVGYAIDSRSKRYALQGSRWRVKELSYKISKYPSKLAANRVDAELERAFRMWADASGLSFVKKSYGRTHIDIRFERGEHGDGDPFDGPGGTLAHAYFPVYGGDAHFDDSETWTVNSYRGTNLFQVAVHEFGHSLGLSHSDVKTAIMAPFYRGYDPSYRLDLDDILGIQALYGKPSTKFRTGFVSTTTTTTQSLVLNDEESTKLCNDESIDTIFNTAEQETYLFKGEHYWRITETGVDPGYPHLISDSWEGLPGHIDAAFTYSNGRTYFFKGSHYWRYRGFRMEGDYPKLIHDGFRGIPDNIDATFVWNGNGKIYFFKGTRFWRYDPSQRPPVMNVYPKPISNWEGVPDNLDAALQYTNGYTYFFKRGQYYRFNDRSFSVDTADPPFPRPTKSWWFDCKAESKNHNLGSNVWFLAGSYPGLAELPVGDLPQKSSLWDDSDPHGSDVDDLILDADANSQPHDDKGRAAPSTNSNDSLRPHLILVALASLLAFTRRRSS